MTSQRLAEPYVPGHDLQHTVFPWQLHAPTFSYTWLASMQKVGQTRRSHVHIHEVMAPPSDSVQTSQDQDLHHHGSPHRTIYFMDSTLPHYGEATSNNLLYSCTHLWWYMHSTNHLLYMLLLQKPYTSCTVQEAHHQMCSSVLHSCTV